MKFFILIFSVVILSLNECKPQSESSMIDNSTVKNLNLKKYLGTWYEIARFPHRFEKDLVGVTATYSLKPDGKIKVVNQGHKETLDGPLKVAEGKAKIPDKDNSGHFKVSFFWIFYSDYLVMELDEDYKWVMIGSSSPKYLWILSRTPQMNEKTYNMLVENARKRGYDVSKLILVKQKP